jgi:hypothetical protein
MSIVALKRNSRRFQVPVSANGFSLNGGHRNQRVIGNTNLSALTHGQNNCCTGNDPSIVKLSTKNTKGHHYSALLFPTCPLGIASGSGGTSSATRSVNWVKNFSPETRSAGQYITHVVQANAATCVTKKTNSGAQECKPDCKARSYYIGGRLVYTTYNAKNSGEYGQGAISAGEYLKAGLIQYQKYRCKTTQKSIAPIPPALLNSGCVHC